ncbi:cyclic nucleotide-binding domain-containing protein [Megasphaera elsdenii]|nr:cyclic nucleotide-binding domain-containing protein [Megasphaera elsdenii]
MTDSLPILPDDLPFFTGISPDKRMAMLTCLGARVRTVRKGEFLVLAQDEVRYIGIVLSGEIHMIHEDRWGDKAVLAVIRSGGLFGETFVCGTVLQSIVTF